MLEENKIPKKINYDYEYHIKKNHSIKETTIHSSRCFENAGIYAIINKTNYKFYIGSTIYLNTRWWNHLIELRNNTHHNCYLQNSFNKHGEENFVFIVIEKIDTYGLDIFNASVKVREIEQIYLDYYKPYERAIGYNLDKIATGGKKGFTIEDFKKGKSKYSYDTLNKVISDLINTSKSFRTIAKEREVTASFVRRIYYKDFLKEYLDEINFYDRRKKNKNNIFIDDIDKVNKLKNMIENKIAIKEICKYFNLDTEDIQNVLIKLRIDVDLGLYQNKGKIYKMDLLGNKIEEYNSVYEAAFKNNMEMKYIPEAIKKTYVVRNGYLWSNKDFIREPTVLEKLMGQYKQIDKKLRPVIKYNDSGVPIKFYKSKKYFEEDDYLPNEIRKNCSGKTSSYMGYIWKYADEVPEKDLIYLYNKTLHLKV